MPPSPAPTPPRTRVPLAVHEGDVRRPPPALRALAFDRVLANPPFHGAAAAARADAGRDAALREGEAARRLDRCRPPPPRAPAEPSPSSTVPDRLAAILAALDGRAGAVETRCPSRPAPAAPRPGFSSARARGAGAPPPLAALDPARRDRRRARRRPLYCRAQRVLRGMAAIMPGESGCEAGYACRGARRPAAIVAGGLSSPSRPGNPLFFRRAIG